MSAGAVPSSTRSYTLASEQATIALGRALAPALEAVRDGIRAQGLAIGLTGDLGAGKTTAVRALLRALGVQGAVKSPTFALLEPYEVSRLNLYHFDFYRFKNPKEFLDGGFSEYFGPGCVDLVEWPERAGAYLPALDLDVVLQVTATGRSARLTAHTEIGSTCLKQLALHFAR